MSQAISTQSSYLTFEAYLTRDDDPDRRYELVNGVLVEMPPESDENLGIARKLFLELVKHLPVDRVVWGTEVEVMGMRATCRNPDLLVHTAGAYCRVKSCAVGHCTRHDYARYATARDRDRSGESGTSEPRSRLPLQTHRIRGPRHC